MSKILDDAKHTGMICPSTRFLIDKMLKKIDWNKANTIVLLWYWNWCFVKRLQKVMPKNTKLYVFEINEFFLKNYKIELENVVYINDSAEFIEKYVDTKVDVIISTLPLASIPKKETVNILNAIKNSLAPNGLYVQYQYFMSQYSYIKKVFEWNKVFLDFEILNLPPAFVYSVHYKNK